MENGTYTFHVPLEEIQENSAKVRDMVQQAFSKAQEDNAFDVSGQVSAREREKNFLALIAGGNPILLEEYLSRDFPADRAVDIGVLSEDPLQQAKYIFVTGITLVTRTAMDSGLPEKLARDISDGFIRHVDKMVDVQEIGVMFLHAAKTFCIYIGTHRMSRVSPEIRSCCEYLNTHLHAAVTIEDLSRATHLSAYQLTALFHQELNTTPIQYFLGQKMEYAKNLLETSNLPVSEIAEMLAFPSHSNFSQRFKKRYGVTPQTYRSQSTREI